MFRLRFAVAATSSLLLAAVFAQAAQPICSGQAYDPSGYVCPNGKLCPKSNPCECPNKGGYDCYHTTGDEARTCSSSGGLSPSGQPTNDNGGGVCAVGSSGDPVVQGFDGCSWYMRGQAGTVVNLITEASHVVNSQLVSANLTDDSHKNDGTFHGAISMRYKNVVVTAAADPEGNLTVALGDLAVPFEATRKQDGLTLKVSQFLPYYGQVAEVSTPTFRFFLHAVQPYNTSAGWSRGHLDFTATMMSGVSAHGLLGQTVPRAGSTCPEHFDFVGEGSEEDYVVSDLLAVNFEYNQFSGQAVSRRLQASEAVFEPLFPTLTAVSRGLY